MHLKNVKFEKLMLVCNLLIYSIFTKCLDMLPILCAHLIVFLRILNIIIYLSDIYSELWHCLWFLAFTFHICFIIFHFRLCHF